MRSSSRSPMGHRLIATLGILTALLLSAVGPWSTPVRAAGTDAIAGNVFQDLNRNGTIDPGEAGFANLRINLFDSSGVNIAAAYTDSAGNYQFGALADGSYLVAIDGSAWTSYSDLWVMTNIPAPAPGYLDPKEPVTLAGSATIDFALRPIVRSTTSPITSYRAADGMLVQSYDDVVPAASLYDQLGQGQFLGSAASPLTTINFDFGINPNITTFSCAGIAGSYTSYNAVTYLTYASWRDQFDDILFHEHGHEWSLYNACLVQQDLTLSGYLRARGLLGNPLVGSSYAWDPKEMIAEDYRQLFGTATAAAYPQMNTAIPLASQVAGLKDWLEYTFTTPPTTTQPASTQPAPSVMAVSPDLAPGAGGTIVTITGANFSGSGYSPSAVMFGSQAAASFTVVSATQLTAVAPAGSGSVDVTVTTMQSTGSPQVTSSVSSADVFNYVPAPIVTSVSPASGSRRGGTTVTISGVNFSGTGYTITAVYFGSVAVTRFTLQSSTSLTAVSPAGQAGTSVPVKVTTAGGTSTASSACTFTYTKR